MGTDLNIRSDSLENRTDATNTDLRIGQYEFFTGGEAGRYATAARRGQARVDGLKESLFTSSFSGGGGAAHESEALSMHVLETAPEYTQGLYDENGAGGAGDIGIIFVFAGVCALTFFATRAIRAHKTKQGGQNEGPNNDKLRDA